MASIYGEGQCPMCHRKRYVRIASVRVGQVLRCRGCKTWFGVRFAER
jgi:ribosomal protein L37AE/L43A